MAKKELETNNAAVADRMPDKKQIEQEEAELERKNKWIYPTVIVVLILFFVVGFTYGLSTVLSMEGAYPEPVLTESKTQPPADNEALLAYLNTVIARAKQEKPAFSRAADYEIDSDGIVINTPAEGQETLLKTLAYITDDADDFLDDKAFPARVDDADPNKRDFFQGFDELLVEPAFTADDIVDFSVNYIYYRCISCGNESADPLNSCEECGSEYPYQLMYRDQYEIAVELKPGEDLIVRNFSPMSEEEIASMLSPALKGYASVSAVQKDYQTLKVFFRVNRATDELTSLSYEKTLNATVTAAFEDDFSALGELNVVIPVTEKNVYSFTWPGLSLNLHTMSLEPKGKDNLLATLSCDDPTAYDAVWTSSDPEIVAVDNEGYLTAGKKDGGTATITATFEFGGKTYSDTCDVTVKNSVESMKLNKRHISLSVGGTEQLKATVSPKKATIKTASWYTTDPAVVTVDENGQITAIAAGIATVYALSDDGAYRSSCEVTVK